MTYQGGSAYTSLQNNTICGGSFVDLSVTDIAHTWEVFVEDEPTPGKNTTNWNPHELDFMGTGNQKWNITGKFFAGSTVNEPGGTTGSVLISVPLIGSFCNCGSPSWFQDELLILNSVGSCLVLPSTPLCKRSPTDDPQSAWVTYTLTLVETKSWT
jgi:hypothetical protein